MLDLEFSKILGPVGRSLAIKNRYQKYQNNILIHQVYLFVDGQGIVWKGDLDLTSDERKIKKLAQKFNLAIYLVKELGVIPFPQARPKISECLFKITGRKLLIHNQLTKSCFRDSSGKLRCLEGKDINLGIL